MHAHPSGRSSKKQAWPRGASSDSREHSAEEDTAALRQRMQDQMLVNQALAVRIFAYTRATEALHHSERRLHELLAHQFAIRETERQRLALVLHDSLAQNLLALRCDIAALHRETGRRYHRLHERVGAALDNLDLTLCSVKHLLGELRPTGIELGVQAAIEIEVRKFRRASGIACVVEGCIPDEPALPEAAVLTVCRVLQESLNNVLRHSMAKQVIVSFASTGGRLLMSVTDNGIGFEPEAPREPGCYGLAGLQERAAAAGGTLDIRSSPDGGTEIRVSLPLSGPPGPAIV